jgi:dTDP-4-dehydrorhamnose reductase
VKERNALDLPLVWITGAGGLIGNTLVEVASRRAPEWRVRALKRQDLDLTDSERVSRRFAEERPQLTIHCAALSSNPACQANPALAYKANVQVTELLTGLAADIPFCFFSTDLVFDGKAGKYSESAPVNPLSIYAETKVAAEEIVLKNPRHTVIRTSLNGGTSPTGDRGFNEQMRRAWQSGQSLKLFTDEFRSPIPAGITAQAVWELVACKRPGIYHVAGSERLSRWQIGQLLAARWPELSAQIEPASLRDYQGAPRPPDTSLDCAKAQALLTFALPRFSEWVASNADHGF